jgi:hypothetical protein
LQEERVNAFIAAEFGVESHNQNRSLPGRDGVSVDLGEDFDGWAILRDPRRSDEERVDRSTGQPHLDVGFETSHLAPEGVAFGAYVDYSQMVAVEHYQSRAGAKDWLAGTVKFSERVAEPFAFNP